MPNIDLTPIIEALIGLLAAIVTYKLIPLIKANTTAKQRELLQVTVRTLVYAAEQIYGSGTGAKKLTYVQEQLRQRGFEVDMAEIEGAVRELATWNPLVALPPLENVVEKAE